MSELLKNNILKFDSETLYSTKALQEMLPRQLFLLVRQTVETPVRGVFYGKAINQALEKIFLASMNEDEIPAVSNPQLPPKKERKKDYGRSRNSGKGWFSISEETQ